ncbi:tRNA (adenine(58)-N(1))-methyltransferase non-catalytic subunit TRM6-like [Haliotis rufescens]|uniref:tRNA (adenine(58)-N(1))-methyltransferase non-catalytic subunit TRM6-like n=1 Tax=Haliotis rufescens TaxID=6454 RepID=UPI00201F10DD|nr:tRNA (adenine(58)-N(1))-methyltransferase non-catalytic subunit TRM6-like [Haliotis rufescens]
MARLIQEGDQVLLKRDDNSGVFQVKRNRQLHFDKAKFTLDGLIGHPFGATFKVEKGGMIRIDDPDEVLNELMETESSAAVRGKDNRDLVAAGSNQKLSQDDILKMKEEGKKGEEIIQELITNSETFENKTEYSQRKYLRKKMKKHVFIFTVLKPTARLLIDMVYTKSPEKISHLRIDSLSQILQYANIMAGINVAIVDTLQGLVVGSVMERMGGMGKVVQFYPGSDLNRHVLNFFDFPSEFKDNLYNFGLKNLPELKTRGQESVRDMKSDTEEKGDNSGEKDCDSSDNGAQTQDSLTKTDGGQAGEKRKGDNSGEKDCDSSNNSGQERAECLDIKMATAEKGDDSGEKDRDSSNKSGQDRAESPDIKMETEEEGDNSVEKACDSNNSAPSQDSRTKTDGIQTGEKRKGDNSEKVEKRLEKARIQDYVKTLILQKDFDCLIVACKHHPTPIVLALLEYVGPSRPVVVYSSYKEALMDCYNCVRERGGVLSLRLTETWYREYQVLPARTHPTMQMTGTGGYLLTFTTVSS